jgi:hypothetical protein
MGTKEILRAKSLLMICFVIKVLLVQNIQASEIPQALWQAMDQSNRDRVNRLMRNSPDEVNNLMETLKNSSENLSHGVMILYVPATRDNPTEYRVSKRPLYEQQNRVREDCRVMTLNLLEGQKPRAIFSKEFRDLYLTCLNNAVRNAVESYWQDSLWPRKLSVESTYITEEDEQRYMSQFKSEEDEEENSSANSDEECEDSTSEEDED